MPTDYSRHGVRDVSFRCPSCGEYTLRSLDWSVKHSSLPCDCCACLIDLETSENRKLIEQAGGRLQKPSAR